ncbi:ketopantoate reductase family protein [Leifsonia shinshuensis]|uniref:Ketopantoate reductase family protein n=1 Tax=Leifsonia shinshuensis TaxID=150026 RepID=A0A7G6Y7U9_9MICO|nr:2-dehydropantoate 2-reductase N-terminal domain-containing protein [Leifsonia shinshuensis]QNE34564.1 ketopantoate reductase family protein [Leifsonia shinshuensis]
MSAAEPVFAVVGPGAVGGLFAWLLSRAGHDVVAVGRPATVEAIRADGIEVRSATFGDGVERVSAATEVPEGASVIVATKAYGLEDVLPGIAAARPSEVVSFLNGVEHMGPLREALPGVPVAGASVAVSALRASTTVIDHRSPFVNIEAPEAAGGFASIRGLAGAGPRVKVGGTEAEVLWAKFRLLSSLALLTSYWRQSAGPALSEDPELTEAVVSEIVACSTAEGVPASALDLVRVLHSVPGGMRTSLQEDLADGHPTELDAIGGALLRIGARDGVPTPAVARIVAALGSNA